MRFGHVQSAGGGLCFSTFPHFFILEADPLKCPDCGEKMRIVSFIEREQKEVIENPPRRTVIAGSG